ncbi:MAG: SRPBCC domain-containing protein [Puia sp.]
MFGFLPIPAETIWAYLTDAELLSQWLMKNDFKPVVGHQFSFRASAAPSIEFDGNVYCEVLEITAPEKLTYSWKFGPGTGEIDCRFPGCVDAYS